MEIETRELRTTFAVYGPVTPALREEFLNYRAEMNAATLRGKQRALRRQEEDEDLYKRRPELLGPNTKEDLARNPPKNRARHRGSQGRSLPEGY
ncbi:hypothetical protein ACU4HD_47715 [Cupriavidus basilensis]